MSHSFHLFYYISHVLEYIFVLSGASMLGVPVTTVNPSYTAPDVARQFQMSKTKMAVTTEALLPVVLEAVKLAKGEK